MKKKTIIIIFVALILAIGLYVVGKSYLLYENNNKPIYNNEETKNEKEESKKELEKAKLNADGTIFFPDKNLENAIKKYLNINDEDYKITKEEAEKITDLDLQDSYITNIAGLEYFTNLEELNLMYNGISEINTIKNLVNLKGLWLDTNFIKEISSISNLYNLEVLNIANNEVSDISPIIKLNHLGEPFLNGNPIINYDILINYVDRMVENDAKIIDLDEEFIKERKKILLDLYTDNQAAVNQMKLWVENNIEDNMSDLQKEYRIINYILDKYQYETEDNSSSYINIYEMYNKGEIVCFGYSLIFQYLAKFSGLEGYRVYTNQSIDEIQEGFGNHVWNVVKIDNNYYQIDLTWADDEEYDYSYINISNSTMEDLHINKFPIYMLEIYNETNIDMPKDIQKKYWVENNN